MLPPYFSTRTAGDHKATPSKAMLSAFTSASHGHDLYHTAPPDVLHWFETNAAFFQDEHRFRALYGHAAETQGERQTRRSVLRFLTTHRTLAYPVEIGEAHDEEGMRRHEESMNDALSAFFDNVTREPPEAWLLVIAMSTSLPYDYVNDWFVKARASHADWIKHGLETEDPEPLVVITQDGDKVKLIPWGPGCEINSNDWNDHQCAILIQRACSGALNDDGPTSPVLDHDDM
ncbi:hypothetical protein AX16_010141 [Volvariella volvacea WC 439]|nr:hypothetical protein AX16_010141 [Volvariella volvacea WC 439]